MEIKIDNFDLFKGAKQARLTIEALTAKDYELFESRCKEYNYNAKVVSFLTCYASLVGKTEAHTTFNMALKALWEYTTHCCGYDTTRNSLVYRNGFVIASIDGNNVRVNVSGVEILSVTFDSQFDSECFADSVVHEIGNKFVTFDCKEFLNNKGWDNLF